MVINVSGSWFSKEDSRFLAFIRTYRAGTAAPTNRAASAHRPRLPSTNAVTNDTTIALPSWM